MHLLAPLNLLWLPLIGGLIVVMYILKLRRKDVIVSSTFLWQQVIRDVQANAPFQKLRRNLLLFLQLLIAALIIFALARPFLRLLGLGGRNIVLVVDTSASMRATDITPSRLDAAKRQALDLVNTMKPGDQMMVLSAAARPETATGFTAERAELRRAVDSLIPHDTPANMRDALNLAGDLVASRNNGDNGLIALISDGGFDAPQNGNGGSATLTNLHLGHAHLQYYPVGSRADNVGITSVDFRRNLGSARTLQLLVVTHNFSTRPRTFNEEVYAESNLLDAHEVTLPPSGEDTQSYDDIPEPQNPVTLRVKLDLKDDLATDNEAALVIRPRKPLRVLLVSGDNLFLENALKVDPSIELSKTELSKTDSAGKTPFMGGKGFEVVIFDDIAPPKLPEGNYLFLHCVSDQAPVKVSGDMENVSVADADRDHPALRYVDFGDDRFESALKATPLDWGKELAVGESGSLIVAGERNRTRALFVGMELNKSLFYMRVAFPIFIANSVRWLGTGSDDSERGQVHTGDPVTLAVAPSVGKVTITRPDGSKREVMVGERGGAVFDEADIQGVYKATGAGYQDTFAANLASPAASDTTPRRQLSVTDNPTTPPGRRVADNREVLPLLVLLALLALCVEWWAFHRRVYVN